MLTHGEFVKHRRQILKAPHVVVPPRNYNLKRCYLCAMCGRPLTNYSGGLYGFSSLIKFYRIDYTKGFSCGLCFSPRDCWQHYKDKQGR